MGGEQGASAVGSREANRQPDGGAWGSHGESKQPAEALSWSAVHCSCLCPFRNREPCKYDGELVPWGHRVGVLFPDTVVYVSFFKDLLKGSQERSEATFYLGAQGSRHKPARVPEGVCRALSHLERHFFGSGPVLPTRLPELFLYGTNVGIGRILRISLSNLF